MIKTELHPHNKHRDLYEFQKLVKVCPELKKFIISGPSGQETIHFSDPDAVKALNKALILFYYHLDWWDIPKNFLCPPVPGRADYIHYLRDLIGPVEHAKVLDIGTGANCIYPIIGSQEYGWNFVGSDISNSATQNAQKIVSKNPTLSKKIEIRLQPNSQYFFKNIVKENEHFAASICNPPFHASKKEAEAGTGRKLRNLGSGLNFGGQSNELWCEGGEKEFLTRMIQESSGLRDQIKWFTSLVSKKENLSHLQKILEKSKVKEFKTINMAQGQKITRIMAWSWNP